MRRWLHGLQWRTCSTCGREFRKSKIIFPSLVGFAYCSNPCEAQVWRGWIRS